MRRSSLMAAAFLSVLGWRASGAEKANLDTAKIQQLTGAKGQLDEREGNCRCPARSSR